MENNNIFKNEVIQNNTSFPNSFRNALLPRIRIPDGKPSEKSIVNDKALTRQNVENSNTIDESSNGHKMNMLITNTDNSSKDSVSHNNNNQSYETDKALTRQSSEKNNNTIDNKSTNSDKSGDKNDKALTKQPTENNKGNQGYLKYLKESDPDRFNEIIAMGVKARIESNNRKKTIKNIFSTLLNEKETISYDARDNKGIELTLLEIMSLKVLNDIAKNPTIDNLLKLQKLLGENYKTSNHDIEDSIASMENRTIKSKTKITKREELERERDEIVIMKNENEDLLKRRSNETLLMEKCIRDCSIEEDKIGYQNRIFDIQVERQQINYSISYLENRLTEVDRKIYEIIRDKWEKDKEKDEYEQDRKMEEMEEMEE